MSIDQFVSEIKNRQKNDLAELDKKLGDKKSEIDTQKNSTVKDLKENYANEAKTKVLLKKLIIKSGLVFLK